jgi:hypothetical protein
MSPDARFLLGRLERRQDGRETVEAALEMVGDVHEPERRGLPPMVRRAERAAPVTRFEAQIVAHEEALCTEV